MSIVLSVHLAFEQNATYPHSALTLPDGTDMYVRVYTSKDTLSPSAGTLLVELLTGAYPGERVAVIDARRGTVVLPQSGGARATEDTIKSYLDAYRSLWEIAA